MAAITFLLVVLFASVVANAIERISGLDLGVAGVFIVIALMAWARACWKFWDDPDKYVEDAERKDTIIALPAAVTFFAITYAIATLTFGSETGDSVAVFLFLGAMVVYAFFSSPSFKRKTWRTLRNKRGWPSRTEWANIATNISVGLEESRRKWFDSCLSTLEEESKKRGESLKTKIVCRSLSGQVDVAIRTYQLWQTLTFLSKNEEYIRRSDLKDFADNLFLQVRGRGSSWNRYAQVDEGKGELRFRIDVVNEITDFTYVEGPDLLCDLVEDLTKGTHSVVARAFSDEVKEQETESY